MWESSFTAFANFYSTDKRKLALSCACLLALVIIGVDVGTRPHTLHAYLYLLPLLLAAPFLPPWLLVVFVLVFVALGEALSSGPFVQQRLFWAVLLQSVLTLTTRAVVLDRRRHLDQEARLKALVEASPLAILTCDKHGFIDLANRAAADLLGPKEGDLLGSPVTAYLPILHNVLRQAEKTQYRVSTQCLGHRGDGEAFGANVWFSTYKDGSAVRIAAMVAASGAEEPAVVAAEAVEASSWRSNTNLDTIALTNREIGVLKLVVRGLGNKEIATQASISESTVKHTLQQLFQKTGVRTRAQLVRVALEQDLL